MFEKLPVFLSQDVVEGFFFFILPHVGNYVVSLTDGILLRRHPAEICLWFFFFFLYVSIRINLNYFYPLSYRISCSSYRANERRWQHTTWIQNITVFKRYKRYYETIFLKKYFARTENIKEFREFRTCGYHRGVHGHSKCLGYSGSCNSHVTPEIFPCVPLENGRCRYLHEIDTSKKKNDPEKKIPILIALFTLKNKFWRCAISAEIRY